MRNISGNKKALVTSAAVGLALGSLLSCSYLTDFVFMNATSAPARVEYTFREPGDWEAPSLSDRAKGPWQTLTPAQYQTSPDRKHVSVAVPPGRALRLFTLSNYPGNDLRGLERFPVVHITVSDGRSSVTVAAERALLAFQRWNKALYVFPAYELTVSQKQAHQP
jgi:hypothetical protein